MPEFIDLISEDERYHEFYKSLHTTSKSPIKKVIPKLYNKKVLLNKFKAFSVKDSYKSQSGKTYLLPKVYKYIGGTIDVIDKKHYSDLKEYLLKSKSYKIESLMEVPSIKNSLIFGDVIINKKHLGTYLEFNLNNSEYLLIPIKNHQTLLRLSSSSSWCVRQKGYWDFYMRNSCELAFYILFNLATKERILIYTKKHYATGLYISEYKKTNNHVPCNFNINALPPKIKELNKLLR